MFLLDGDSSIAREECRLLAREQRYTGMLALRSTLSTGYVATATVVPLSVIIPSTNVVPFHFGMALFVAEETCGSVSVTLNAEAFTQLVAPAPLV